MATTATPPTAPAAPPPLRNVTEPPIVGSAPEIMRNRIPFFDRIAAECGDMGTYHYGPFKGYFLNTPALAHELLVERGADFEKGPAQRAAFRPVTGDSILILEGAAHRKRRQSFAPAFQPRSLAHYADAMTASIAARAEGWTDGATLNLNHEMTTLTLRVVGQALFDADLAGQDDALGAAMTAAVQYVEHALLWIMPPPLWIPTPLHRRTRRAVGVIERTVQGLIDDRRRAGGDAPDAANDFLSMLLAARDAEGNPLTDAQVRHEAVTLFAAGHETTAQALSWAWFLLASHPDAYDRLRDEADTALGGRLPTAADLPRLPYALRVFKEALRLYPPAAAIVRLSLRETELGGHALPKGASVLLAPWSLHRRPDLFPDPLRFDPDRWTPERERALPRHAWLPFGAGSRVCIGQHFALMEGQLTLATLAARVRFDLVPGQNPQPIPTLTLRPEPAVQVVARRR